MFYSWYNVPWTNLYKVFNTIRETKLWVDEYKLALQNVLSKVMEGATEELEESFIISRCIFSIFGKRKSTIMI